MNTDDAQVLDKEGRKVAPSSDNVRVETVTPIVVDLGKRSRKKIRALKEGRGELMAEVGEALQRVRAADVLEGRDLLPVVLIYRQKSRRGRGGRGGFGLTSLMPPPFNLLR